MVTRRIKGKIETCAHNFVASAMKKAYHIAWEQIKAEDLESYIESFDIEIKITINDKDGGKITDIKTIEKAKT